MIIQWFVILTITAGPTASAFCEWPQLCGESTLHRRIPPASIPANTRDSRSAFGVPIMEQINLGYSTKNIPVPDQKTYLTMLISSFEQGLHRMQCAALHHLYPKTKSSKQETFGFTTPLPPPNLEQLQDFKHGLVKIVENIQFSKHTNPLQEKIKEDIKVIKSSDKLLIGADKTTNFYKVNLSYMKSF